MIVKINVCREESVTGETDEERYTCNLRASDESAINNLNGSNDNDNIEDNIL